MLKVRTSKDAEITFVFETEESSFKDFCFRYILSDMLGRLHSLRNDPRLEIRKVVVFAIGSEDKEVAKQQQVLNFLRTAFKGMLDTKLPNYFPQSQVGQLSDDIFHGGDPDVTDRSCCFIAIRSINFESEVGMAENRVMLTVVRDNFFLSGSSFDITDFKLEFDRFPSSNTSVTG